MSVKTLAQAQLAAIIAGFPTGAVTVVANGVTVSGMRDTQAGDAALEGAGENGTTTSVVRCNADSIGTVSNGDLIKVDGVTCYVQSTRLDALEAVVDIAYEERT